MVGVFCTQMPPESKPVEISEMQPVLTKAEETMTTAVDFYMKGTQHAQHAQPALQVSTNGAFEGIHILAMARKQGINGKTQFVIIIDMFRCFQYLAIRGV